MIMKAKKNTVLVFILNFPTNDMIHPYTNYAHGQ